MDDIEYMHRQGRTERLGKDGLVFNFISEPNEKKFVENVRNEYGLKIKHLKNDEQITENFKRKF